MKKLVMIAALSFVSLESPAQDLVQSWALPDSVKAADHSLANISGVSTLLLGFARPDLSYTLGKESWDKTGLDFSSKFEVVRNAITIFKMKNPEAKVLLSVGGPVYLNWPNMNPRAVAALVSDLGLDGADLNFQPIVDDDVTFVQAIKAFRDYLPRPLSLTGTMADPNKNVYLQPLKVVGGHFEAIYIPVAAAKDTLKAYQEIYNGPTLWSRIFSR